MEQYTSGTSLEYYQQMCPVSVLRRASTTMFSSGWRTWTSVPNVTTSLTKHRKMIRCAPQDSDDEGVKIADRRDEGEEEEQDTSDCKLQKFTSQQWLDEIENRWFDERDDLVRQSFQAALNDVQEPYTFVLHVMLTATRYLVGIEADQCRTRPYTCRMSQTSSDGVPVSERVQLPGQGEQDVSTG